MRVTLPESGRQRSRSLGGTTASTLVHAALICGVVVTTGYGRDHLTLPGKPDVVVLIAPRAPKRDVPRPAHAVPSRPMVPTNVMIPPVVTAPLTVNIPDGLPPIDSRIGTVSLEDFAASSRASVPTAPHAAGREDQPYTDLTVERQVVARPGNLPPRYPDPLRNAGVEGTVHAQFVVDTTGRVERESIRFKRSDHQLFERAVTETLLRSRYLPAESGGRKVRQLVEQAFSFTLGRSS
jgi:protein TonB